VNVGARLGAFAAIVVVAFGAAFALGAAVGPDGDENPTSTTSTTVAVDHGGHS